SDMGPVLRGRVDLRHDPLDEIPVGYELAYRVAALPFEHAFIGEAGDALGGEAEGGAVIARVHAGHHDLANGCGGDVGVGEREGGCRCFYCEAEDRSAGDEIGCLRGQAGDGAADAGEQVAAVKRADGDISDVAGGDDLRIEDIFGDHQRAEVGA